jgi:hypothetical protein
MSDYFPFQFVGLQHEPGSFIYRRLCSSEKFCRLPPELRSARNWYHQVTESFENQMGRSDVADQRLGALIYYYSQYSVDVANRRTCDNALIASTIQGTLPASLHCKLQRITIC